MLHEFFPEVESPIQYEGKESDNPLAFKFYNPDQRVGDRTMAEHFRFAVAYWHTMMGDGTDMFGGPAYQRPWWEPDDPMDRARATLRAAFEFFQKLGVDYYCFHDRDIAPEGENFAETCRNLKTIVEEAKQLQEDTGKQLLWGTACLFADPIYTHGAASNPDAHVFAHAAAQVKNAIDVTHELGGVNYVFWGGREGYETLLNTDYGQEQEQLARFFHMAVDYKKKIGFGGQFLIEPKPCEPTKHQYDHDAATVLGFLREFDLWDDFQLNVEANHATLAGHTFHHDLTVASAAGMLGSIDANRGDLMLGWDTDQFPTDIYDTTYAMLIVLNQGGLGSGGLNFDAHARRGSFDTVDLFHAHIGGMDTFARGLLVAHEMMQDEALSKNLRERYSSYNSGIGKEIMSGTADLESLEAFILKEGMPALKSGRQEALENVVNSYIL
ncbi:MAG TPA: xylose isomerase [bacterium]|nr:xylose isomerase [bacterium]